jgi:hypothetical protein
MKYRKKPVVIEAWRWLDETDRPLWIDDAVRLWPETGGIAFEPDHPDGPRIAIATLEGVMIAKPDAWIIRGIKGELYACQPDVFEQTYELAGG